MPALESYGFSPSEAESAKDAYEEVVRFGQRGGDPFDLCGFEVCGFASLEAWQLYARGRRHLVLEYVRDGQTGEVGVPPFRVGDKSCFSRISLDIDTVDDGGGKSTR